MNIVIGTLQIDLQCEQDERSYCVCEKIVSGNNLYTNFYMNNKNTNNFYVQETFGINLANKLGLDPCTPIKYRYQFKKIVGDANIKCTGEWCIDGDFKCTQRDKRNCYHMEHIFAKEGPNFNIQTKNILANLVFAAGPWNQELGRMIRHGQFKDELNEKNVVYGKEIMDKIKATLSMCSTKIAKRWNVDEVSCAKSCTCESTEELDMICDCDYDESGFDYSSCINSTSIGSAPLSISTWIAIISVILNLCGIIALIMYLLRKRKRFNPADYGY